MRVLIGIWMLVCWIGVGGWTSSGMMSVSVVTPERAEKMGIEVTSRAAGPKAVWVTLKFKREGAFEHYGPERYSRVELRMGSGQQPEVIAGLQERQRQEGEVEVGLMVGRDKLDATALMVVVGSGLIPVGGFELKLKEFVDLEVVDAERKAWEAKAAKERALATPVPAAEVE